jgi:hypothetical protein
LRELWSIGIGTLLFGIARNQFAGMPRPDSIKLEMK